MYKQILLGLILILGLPFLCKVNAQGSSNAGTDFWVAYAGHVDDTKSKLTLFITSQQKATVMVDAGGAILPAINIAANQSVPVYIDPKTYTNTYIDGSDVKLPGRGIHVTSDVPIVLYAHISNSARSGATLVLPTNALGNEYIAMAYQQNASSNTEKKVSQFTIIGVEDNTTVEITPTITDLAGSHPANQTFPVTLNKGDAYQYQSTKDVTGTRIKTLGGCQPVAVFSGSTKSGFCENSVGGSEDNLYQQLFPTSAWGKNFVTAPFFNAQNGVKDIFRIFVNEDNTEITTTESNTLNTSTTTYNKGAIVTFASSNPYVINANKPVSVAQLQVTQSCNPNNTNDNSPVFPGDPEMTMLNPIEQTLSDITLYSAISTTEAPTNIRSHYINIILKTAAIPSLRLDGSAITGTFSAINNIYSFITVDVTASSTINPSHRITCDDGFVAIAYGYGNHESYAYLAGADAKNLNAFIQIFPPGEAAAATSNLCLGETYSVKLKLPYPTTQIIWDLNNGASVNTVAPATPIGSETVDGQTSYFYAYQINSADIPTTGNYSLKATVINPNPTSCSATEEISSFFSVYDLPEAKFSLENNLCKDAIFKFTDESDGKAQIVSAWLWDFGDPASGTTNTSNLQNPTHRFSSSGDKTVTLTVKTDKGCWSDAVEHPVHVNSLPEAAYETSTNTCEQQEIQFTDKSTDIDGTVNSWYWDFGDGGTSNEQNPKHTYAAAGNYPIKLSIATTNHCDAQTYQTLTVNPLVSVDFTTPAFCLNDATATFINKSSIANNTAITYVWDFGDPNNTTTSTTTDGVHNYTSTGIYTVKLTATSASGCVTEKTNAFTVNGRFPLADFFVENSADLCSQNEVVFTDNSSVDFGEITKIEWYFDADNETVPDITDLTPTLRSLPHKQYPWTYPKFSAPATKDYKVMMIVYSGSACRDVLEKTITLKASPDISFDALPDVCLNDQPFLVTQAKENSGLSGNGIFSGAGIQTNSIFYPAVAGIGTHTITYTFTADNGCTATLQESINVVANPILGPDQQVSILAGGSTKLNPNLTENGLSYKWSPSIGLSQDNIANPIASPTKTTHYTLTITNTNGCTATNNWEVTVLDLPEIPNVFTPNNDGVNDRWNIKYLDTYNHPHTRIFNRYGNIVYESNTYVQGWDGKANGTDLPQGVYYYLITVEDKNLKYSGSLTIIR